MDLISKIVKFLYSAQQRLVAFLSDFLSVLYVRVYLIILFFLNLSLWLLVYVINKQPGQDLIALHYNVDFGVNLIGKASNTYVIPCLGITTILMNGVLSSTLIKQKNSKFIIHTLMISAILVHIFLFAAVATIYLVNFRYT